MFGRSLPAEFISAFKRKTRKDKRMPWTAQFDVNTTAGIKHIIVEEGTTQFIAGPNGVGKSSLLHHLYRMHMQDKTIEILPGHRQITFPNDDIDQIGQTLEQLQTNMKAGGDAFSRFRGAWGDAHLKSFIKRALYKDADINYKIAELVRNKQSTDLFIAENPSIVRSINSVFTAARLKISIEIQDGRFKAAREGSSFGVDVLSDGERAALLLVCAILAQKKDGILLIDEPEKHLNAAISGPLIASAIQLRPDLAFVISSHDLELIKWVKPRQIIHLRNSQLNGPASFGPIEMRTYEIELLDPSDGVSDEIKQAILGSKEKILFVEGTSASDDRLLYSLVYKDKSVVARGGWETVVNNVRVLRQNGAYAWISASGMIDNDGRNDAERTALSAEQIHCVDAPTIENLFMHPEIIRIMADEVHRFFGGDTPAQRLDDAEKAIVPLLVEHKSDIVYRRCVWIINRLVSEKKVSVKSLAAGKTTVDGINLTDIIRRQYAEFEALLDTVDPFLIISKVPIKTTKIPGRVSKALGFDGFDKMKQAVLKHMNDGGPVAEALLNAVSTRLPVLPA